MAKCFNKKPPHKFITPFIAEMVWRWESLKSILSGKDPLLTKETRENSPGLKYIRIIPS